MILFFPSYCLSENGPHVKTASVKHRPSTSKELAAVLAVMGSWPTRSISVDLTSCAEV